MCQGFVLGVGGGCPDISGVWGDVGFAIGDRFVVPGFVRLTIGTPSNRALSFDDDKNYWVPSLKFFRILRPGKRTKQDQVVNF